MNLNKKKIQKVSEQKIKEITKKRVVASIKKWRINKEKKGVDTSHFVLEIISPHERLVSAIIQSCQTSLGTTFWEELIREIAVENNFIICDKKQFFKPDTDKLNYIIDKWKTKREVPGASITLEEYKEELIKKIEENFEEFKNIDKKKAIKGDGLDIWLKKNDTNYLLEIKTPHVNSGAGKDFSHKLMKMYHHHLFWEPKSKVVAQMVFPYNPFEVAYEIAEKGRIAPLIKDVDYLVGDDFWKFISGNSKCMTYLKEAIIEANEESDLYGDIKHFIKKQTKKDKKKKKEEKIK